MVETGFNFLDEVVENRATGYIKNVTGGYMSNIFTVPTVNASGGLISTVGDFLKLDQALYGNVLLSERSKRKMFTVNKNNYGYTMTVDQRNGNKIVGHGGAALGIAATFARFLNDQYVLVVLSNYDYRTVSISVANTIEAIMFNQKYDMPKLTLSEFLYGKMKRGEMGEAVEGVKKMLSENGYDLRSSGPLNSLGYNLMGSNELEMALEVLKLNVHLFPEEANPYDSLADAYMRLCQNVLAKKNLQKALTIDPKLNDALNHMKELDERMRECSAREERV